MVPQQASILFNKNYESGNHIVTVASTASIVASVVATYFGLKTDIQAIKAQQENQAKVNDLRLKTIENEIPVLQKEVNQLYFKAVADTSSTNVLLPVNSKEPVMLTASHEK